MLRFRHFLAAGVIFAVAPRAPLAAQTFPTSDPAIKRIYTIGMDSTHLYTEAHVLFDSLGPRLMGSPNIKRAQDWIASMYRSWGIDAKEEQYGTWRGWIRGYSHIDLVEPRVRSLEGQMVGWSPGTNGKPEVLSTIILPLFKDSTEFVKWLPQAKGKLVMVAAPFESCRPQFQWDAMGTPASVARIDSVEGAVRADWAVRIRNTGYSMALGGGTLGIRLEDGGAGGIITSRVKLTLGAGAGRGGAGGGRGAGAGRGAAGGAGAAGANENVAMSMNLATGAVTVDTASLRAAQAAAAGRGGRGGGNGTLGGYGAMEIFETYNLKTPAISLNCEDYGLVYRLTEAGDKPKIRLDLESQLLGERPVFNVVATVKGSEKPDEYVVLSSHFDSWDGSSGATDNGTGTLTMLEAMRILRMVYPHPKRTIIAGHWSGEEEGEVGSKAFTEDHPEVIKGLQDVFNQDNGTGRIQGVGGGGMVHAAEHVNMWMSVLPKEFQAVVRANVPGRFSGSGSDGFSFTCYGVPTGDLQAASWDYSTLTWHTERDTYDKVVFDDLKFNATLTAMLAYEASEDPTMIPHEKTTFPVPANARPGQYSPDGWPICEKAPRKTNPRLR